ncbi:DUF3853 family protein [Sphingobacterium sp. 1.A.5]|uniref:DUF3853 family protein n=1 Tax=Sphingobacterium sp. 1.A.5 TaxID=2044604 RepID=UPI000C0BD2DA
MVSAPRFPHSHPETPSGRTRPSQVRTPRSTKKSSTFAEIPKEEATSTLPEFVYGISGIMQLFNCSKSKAQKIKNSGVITGAIQQDQRTIIVDTRLALKLFKEYTNQKKRRFI